MLYPDVKDLSTLSEEQKQTVSALATISAGMAGGLAGDSTGSATAGAQGGKNAAENNSLALVARGCAVAAPCRTKVAEQLLEIGVKAGITGAVAKTLADKLTADELDHLVTLEMMGNDEITSNYLNSLQNKYGSGSASNPNIGKDLTDGEKAELGGAGSGSPGGWEPQDEENARNNEAHSSTNGKNLNSELVGKEIAGGHAFEKHVLQQGEFTGLGIRTRAQFAQHIENVVKNPTSTKELSNGRSAYWDQSTGTVVIRNPKASDGGTAFRPVNGRAYFDNLR
ncbi:VENN motif pre-toxin domain-containing protein [Enterobacter cloacae]|nr:VENN motif pre-toxin domain-containing protein [Enterobacter cloacae]MCK7318337.1 VENN motif pre-toxin domain-containing protein [Enterobacter cloacae]